LTSMLNRYRALPAASACDARITCPVRVIWGDKDCALDRDWPNGAPPNATTPR